MIRRYPFKFLDAYNREDKNFFFGRDEEIEDLYQMILTSSILLVYGASGTGKTSLIQCGLAGRFQSHDWLALSIRRGNDINESLQKVLEDAAQLPESNDAGLEWLDELMNDGNTATSKTAGRLETLLKSVYHQSFRPIYLIFDQFEELFILGSAAEQQQFIHTVQELLKAEQPLKMIFSIREEYLGQLNNFEKAIPQLLRKKLRVEPMNLGKVRQVIEGATSSPHSNVRLKPGESEQIANAIFQKIKGETKTLSIQLPYLQVFLDKLYISITADETRTSEAVFSLDAVNATGNIGDILSNFLEEQITLVAGSLSSEHPELTTTTLWKLLSPFATLEGTKEPTSRASLTERLPDFLPSLIDAIIAAFINRRILRYSDETGLYELAHDSLAKRIAEKRSDEEIAILEVRRLIRSHTLLKADAREIFSEKQLSFMEPFLPKIILNNEEAGLIEQSYIAAENRKETELKQERAEKERLQERQLLLEKSAKAKRTTIWLTSIALLIAGVLLVWALAQRRIALAQSRIALVERASAYLSESKAIAALDNIKKQQALSKALELKGFGDRYKDLGKIEFACDSYRKGLDSIAAYPEAPLFKELTIIIKDSLKCK